MAEGGRIDEFPHDVIGDEALPLRVVVDKGLDVLLQKSARDCHLRSSCIYCLASNVKTDSIEVCANSVPKTGYQAGETIASPDQSYLWHRQTKGPVSARPHLNLRATPRLHLSENLADRVSERNGDLTPVMEGSTQY